MTLSGIVMAFKFEQPINALYPMMVISSGITALLHPFKSLFVLVSIMALQLFLLSNVLLFLSTLMLFKAVEYTNTESSMLLTFWGIQYELLDLIQAQ